MLDRLNSLSLTLAHKQCLKWRKVVASTYRLLFCHPLWFTLFSLFLLCYWLIVGGFWNYISFMIFIQIASDWWQNISFYRVNCIIVDHGVDGDDSQYWKETALLLRLLDIPSVCGRDCVYPKTASMESMTMRCFTANLCYYAEIPIYA